MGEPVRRAGGVIHRAAFTVLSDDGEVTEVCATHLPSAVRAAERIDAYARVGVIR